MSRPKVAVIVVNWNNARDTQACLDSLEKLAYPDLAIILVDNASTDGSADIIRQTHPQVHMVQNQVNLGFTGGNNSGLDLAEKLGADYALLLNNDAELAPDALEKLLAPLEQDPAVCATAPMIYYGEPADRIWSAGGEINRTSATACVLGTDQTDQGQFGEKPYPVDYATGCALLVRMNAIAQSGRLDDRYFMYYEEVEWCGRLREGGRKIMLVPTAKAWHKISPAARNESPFVHYLMTRNRLLWIRCARLGWIPYLRVLLFEDTRTLLSWTLRPRWKHKAAQRRAMLKALQDELRQHYGPPPVGAW